MRILIYFPQMEFRSNCAIHMVESSDWRRVNKSSLYCGKSGASSTFNDR